MHDPPDKVHKLARPDDAVTQSLRCYAPADLRLLLEGAAATFLRVNASLLISAAWTIPAGCTRPLRFPRIIRA